MAQRKLKKKEKRRKKINAYFILFIFMSLVFISNFLWQLFKKPVEVFDLLGLGEVKSPYQTWKSYGEDFKAYSSKHLSASFLAALAQVESSGNPFATPAWKFKWGSQWDHIYKPASSSAGLYQFTRETFEKASRLCIQNGKVFEAGWGRCWTSVFSARISPSRSIEVASAYLNQHIDRLFKKYRKWRVSQRNKERLASLIHLCGSVRGEKYLLRGFTLKKSEQCGSHRAYSYIQRVESLKKTFIEINNEAQ